MVKVSNESKTTNFKDAAFTILKAVNKPLHSDDITLVAKTSGVLKTSGKTPEATMRARLNDDINIHKGYSRFTLVGPSIFSINNYI